MGTRSVIALKTSIGWFGRYVHWDGYPQGVGAGVWHIVQRDGLGEAVKTLITDNKSWSCITASHEKQEEGGRYDALKWVSGYGFAHNDSTEDWYITDDGDKGGTEYAYVLSREGMEVLKVDWDGSCTSLGFYSWDSTPDFVAEAEALFGASA